MSMEWLRQLLDALWDKLKIIFERALNAPEIIRAWSEGRASLGDRASLIVALVLVVAVLAWIVNFFKAGFWKKLGMLFSAALIVFAAAVVLSFFSTTGESPALESPDPGGALAPPQVSGAAENPADAPAPSASPSPEQPSYRRSDGQYSLARGEIDPLSRRASGMWRLCDDTISWQLGDDLVLQMSRLNSLPGVGRFGVEEMAQYGETACIRLTRTEGGSEAGTDRRSECVLEIRVLPGAKLARQSWYAEAPSYVSAGEQVGYFITENSDREVMFLEKDESIANPDGDAVYALCLGRQIEGDVVLVKARAFTSETAEDHVEYTETNPGTDEELHRRLLELCRAVFDGRIRLLRGLSEESIAALLPGKLVDSAVGTPSGRGGFTIPCTRLLEMRRSETLGALIRLTGPGPNGEELLYSLVSGAALYDNIRMDRYFTWRETYEAGWLEPDAEMTAFLGCPAVACDGGWVLDPGDFFSSSSGEMMENYYFLSTQLLTPAPTPEPTPEPAPTETPADTTEGEANHG